MWEDFLLYVTVGLVAQMVDGAIGMAYGVTSNSVLLSFGMPPATASACVHAAETFTTAASGAAHWRLGNVDKKLIVRLAIPGMAGGVLGAYVLSNINGDTIKPIIAVYLLLMGFYIVWKAMRPAPPLHEPPRHVAPLGFAGGLVDSVGGGGWGPIVTSTLIGQGTTPRYAIGTVNLAEFFVTSTVTLTFLFTIGLELWPIITGLVVGGIIAAPFAALATRHLPDKPLMIIVGCVIVLLSLRTLLVALH
ncbi:MAG TPA: sulfite exporter TauE/SafE family protein [Hyphomicrobium sp.]|nr:sulfite exporter TauE/SafE family protein [Hyphomicrobium sp.]